MTSRSRWRWLLMASGAMCGLAVWLLWPGERVTPRAAWVLRAGMKYEEVEQVLGPHLDEGRFGLQIAVIPPPPGYATAGPRPALQQAFYLTSEELRGYYLIMPRSAW